MPRKKRAPAEYSAAQRNAEAAPHDGHSSVFSRLLLTSPPRRTYMYVRTHRGAHTNATPCTCCARGDRQAPPNGAPPRHIPARARLVTSLCAFCFPRPLRRSRHFVSPVVAISRRGPLVRRACRSAGTKCPAALHKDRVAIRRVQITGTRETRRGPKR